MASWLENETRLKVLMDDAWMMDTPHGADGDFLRQPYDQIDMANAPRELPFYLPSDVLCLKQGRNKIRHAKVNRAKTKRIHFI